MPQHPQAGEVAVLEAIMMHNAEIATRVADMVCRLDAIEAACLTLGATRVRVERAGDPRRATDDATLRALLARRITPRSGARLAGRRPVPSITPAWRVRRVRGEHASLRAAGPQVKRLKAGALAYPRRDATLQRQRARHAHPHPPQLGLSG
jgi:hypothetical protein